MTEDKRIIENNNCGDPNSSFVIYRIHPVIAPEKYLHMIKEIMNVVCRYNSDNWPCDDQWSSILPSWFVKGFRPYNYEEFQKNSLLWTFGSWIDAMKYRNWEWYSSCLSKNRIEIKLITLSIPYIIDPFEYIIYASGVDVQSINYFDSLGNSDS